MLQGCKVRLENIGIILSHPQIPENIGSVARAMDNMGLTRLALVNPKNCDLSRVLKTATGSSPEHWMLNIRRFLSTLPLRAREVRIIRGVCRQIDWYAEQLEKIRRENGGG